MEGNKVFYVLLENGKENIQDVTHEIRIAYTKYSILANAIFEEELMADDDFARSFLEKIFMI